MTHSGGKPHAVGYNGQSHKITAFDLNAQKRITIMWLNADTAPDGHLEEILTSLVTRPSWTDAMCEEVKDLQTGA